MIAVGTVFFWDRLIPLKGRIKGRWFIALGKTAYGVQPPLLHAGTTTTQLLYYDQGGYRSGHRLLRIAAGQFGFPEDCILDIDTDIQSIPATSLEGNPDISIRGHVDAPTLAKIYGLVHGSQGIGQILKDEIFFAMRDAGVPVRR